MAKSRGTGNVDELEKEIERFHKLDMDDKGDLKTAEDALEFKKDKKRMFIMFSSYFEVRRTTIIDLFSF